MAGPSYEDLLAVFRLALGSNLDRGENTRHFNVLRRMIDQRAEFISSRDQYQVRIAITQQQYRKQTITRKQYDDAMKRDHSERDSLNRTIEQYDRLIRDYIVKWLYPVTEA